MFAAAAVIDVAKDTGDRTEVYEDYVDDAVVVGHSVCHNVARPDLLLLFVGLQQTIVRAMAACKCSGEIHSVTTHHDQAVEVRIGVLELYMATLGDEIVEMPYVLYKLHLGTH